MPHGTSADSQLKVLLVEAEPRQKKGHRHRASSTSLVTFWHLSVLFILLQLLKLILCCVLLFLVCVFWPSSAFVMYYNYQLDQLS